MLRKYGARTLADFGNGYALCLRKYESVPMGESRGAKVTVGCPTLS